MNVTDTHPGQPAKFKSAQELIDKAQQYFIDGMRYKNVIVGPPNNREVVKIYLPTITGLALYLGFESRQSFYAYEQKEEFSYTIKRLRTLIEREYEENLSVGNYVGAIFALKNFGWSDKIEIDHGLSDAYLEKFNGITDDELNKRYQTLTIN